MMILDCQIRQGASGWTRMERSLPAGPGVRGCFRLGQDGLLAAGQQVLGSVLSPLLVQQGGPALGPHAVAAELSHSMK